MAQILHEYNTKGIRTEEKARKREDEKKKILTCWQETINYPCLWTPETRLEFGEYLHN